MKWVLEQDPATLYVAFITMLRYRDFNELALPGVPYLKKIEDNNKLTPDLRLEAGLSAAYILMQADDHAGAIALLDSGLSIAEAIADKKWQAIIDTTLMRAYSNLGNWDAARQAGLRALEYSRRFNLGRDVAHCTRFLAEIALYAGDPEQALRLCEEAQELVQDLPDVSDGLPDALYWKARILTQLKRWEEASDAIETALLLWLKAGDTKVGLCLCVLGQLHMEAGRYAEACMHLEHAISLHSRAVRDLHRIADVEALGDVFCRMGKETEARPLYEECLAYYLQKSYLPGVNRLQKKSQRCPINDE